MEEQIYTVSEIARRLKVKEKTVRNWIHNGDLVAIYLGKEYRIRESSLQEFIRKREIRNEGPPT
jgi:excisionase family DNA binding protein